MKKVSFSLSSSAQPQSTFRRRNSSSDSNSDDEEPREFISEYDSSKAPSNPTKKPQNRIIPPKPNEWMPSNNLVKRNMDLPPQIKENPSASPSTEDSISNAITYGLNLRKSADASVKQSPSLMSDVDPTLIKLRQDMRRLPEITGFDEFEDMPVEEFGRAFLAGYGWVEGMGIGRNAKEDVRVVECKKWTGNHGLGFIQTAPQRQD